VLYYPRPGTTSSSWPLPTSTMWWRSAVDGRALAHEEGLIEAQRLDETEAVVIVVDQRLAVTKEGVVTVCQSQPSSSAISWTLRPFFPICLVSQRPARSVTRCRERRCEYQPHSTDHGTLGIRTEEPSFVPDDPGRSPVHRQVHQRDPVAVLHPRHTPHSDSPSPHGGIRSGW